MSSPIPRPPKAVFQEAENCIFLYQEALRAYSDAEFIRKPSESDWSVGQVCTHLMDTWFGFMTLKINKCLESEEFANEQLGEYGKILLTTRAFPVLKVKGPPKSTYDPQPAASRNAAIETFERLRKAMQEFAVMLENSGNSIGKRRHPRLGYMNAWEWYELAGIHLNHHWKQKERIDSFFSSLD